MTVIENTLLLATLIFVLSGILGLGLSLMLKRTRQPLRNVFLIIRNDLDSDIKYRSMAGSRGRIYIRKED